MKVLSEYTETMLFFERHHYQSATIEPALNKTEIISSILDNTQSFDTLYDRLLSSMKEGDYNAYESYLCQIFHNTEYKQNFEDRIISFVQALFKTEKCDFIAHFMQKPYCETPHDYFGLMVLGFNNPAVIHEDIFDLVLSQTLAQSEKEYYSNIIKASTIITHLPVFQWYDSQQLLDELTFTNTQIIAMGAITHDNISFLEKFTQKYETLAPYILTTLAWKEKIDFSIVQNVYDCLIRLLPELSENTIVKLIKTNEAFSNKETSQIQLEGANQNLRVTQTFIRQDIIDKFSHDFGQFLLSRKLQNELDEKKGLPRMKI